MNETIVKKLAAFFHNLPPYITKFIWVGVFLGGIVQLIFVGLFWRGILNSSTSTNQDEYYGISYLTDPGNRNNFYQDESRRMAHVVEFTSAEVQKALEEREAEIYCLNRSRSLFSLHVFKNNEEQDSGIAGFWLIHGTCPGEQYPGKDKEFDHSYFGFGTIQGGEFELKGW